MTGREIRAMHEFAVWAPRAEKVAVKVGDGLHSMEGPDDKGWWTASVDGAEYGMDYGFVLNDDPTPYPDPRGMQQPEGVHGPSRLYDQQAFEWSDAQWQGPPLAGAMIYEMHVGTFTPEGTFDGAIERLDYFFGPGVMQIEGMACAALSAGAVWG